MLTFEEKRKLSKEKKWSFLDCNSKYEEEDLKNHSNLLIRKIYSLAEFVDLGSEASDPPQIYLTKAQSYEKACEDFFDSEDEISRMSFKDFEDNYYDEYNGEDTSLFNMIKEFKNLNAICGVVTPKEYINSIEEYDSAEYFYICFFIDITKQTDNNLLIAFPRYEG